jgi:hypothetical protein
MYLSPSPHNIGWYFWVWHGTCSCAHGYALVPGCNWLWYKVCELLRLSPWKQQGLSSETQVPPPPPTSTSPPPTHHLPGMHSPNITCCTCESLKFIIHNQSCPSPPLPPPPPPPLPLSLSLSLSSTFPAVTTSVMRAGIRKEWTLIYLAGHLLLQGISLTSWMALTVESLLAW